MDLLLKFYDNNRDHSRLWEQIFHEFKPLATMREKAKDIIKKLEDLRDDQYLFLVWHVSEPVKFHEIWNKLGADKRKRTFVLFVSADSTVAQNYFSNEQQRLKVDDGEMFGQQCHALRLSCSESQQNQVKAYVEYVINNLKRRLHRGCQNET